MHVELQLFTFRGQIVSLGANSPRMKIFVSIFQF